MWSNLPFDVLANIFSYLLPESFARAKATCRNWNACATTTAPPLRRHPAWFLAWPVYRRGFSCYAHNPVDENWQALSLDFMPCTLTRTRPIASISGLVLLKFTTSLNLAVCNPFTRKFRQIPPLNSARISPAVGVVEINSSHHQIFVAGGMSKEHGGGIIYQSTIEMYDSKQEMWRVISSMPTEYAVRLTVWTPNESVYSKGVLYWMTSARAYSVMGFEIGTKKWTELSVPLADRLDFAALVPRNGNLTLVGGTNGGNVCVWELGGGDDEWKIVEKVPMELRSRILNWTSAKCVGINGSVCLYQDAGSGMIVWREVPEENQWEWCWVEGCRSIQGNRILNFPMKGLLLHPDLVN